MASPRAPTHLDVQPNERGAAFGPAWQAPSRSAATPQQVLAEVPALTQHQGVVEATPEIHGAPEVVYLCGAGEGG